MPLVPTVIPPAEKTGAPSTSSQRRHGYPHAGQDRPSRERQEVLERVRKHSRSSRPASTARRLVKSQTAMKVAGFARITRVIFGGHSRRRVPILTVLLSASTLRRSFGSRSLPTLAIVAADDTVAVTSLSRSGGVPAPAGFARRSSVAPRDPVLFNSDGHAAGPATGRGRDEARRAAAADRDRRRAMTPTVFPSSATPHPALPAVDRWISPGSTCAQALRAFPVWAASRWPATSAGGRGSSIRRG